MIFALECKTVAGNDISSDPWTRASTLTWSIKLARMLTTSVASTSSSPHWAKESFIAVKNIVVGHLVLFAAGFTSGFVSLHMRYLATTSAERRMLRDQRQLTYSGTSSARPVPRLSLATPTIIHASDTTDPILRNNDNTWRDRPSVWLPSAGRIGRGAGNGQAISVRESIRGGSDMSGDG